MRYGGLQAGGPPGRDAVARARTSPAAVAAQPVERPTGVRERDTAAVLRLVPPVAIRSQEHYGGACPTTQRASPACQPLPRKPSDTASGAKPKVSRPESWADRAERRPDPPEHRPVLRGTRDVTSAFKRCRGWREVAAVLRAAQADGRPLLNHISLSAALSHLAQLEGSSLGGSNSCSGAGPKAGLLVDDKGAALAGRQSRKGQGGRMTGGVQKWARSGTASGKVEPVKRDRSNHGSRFLRQSRKEGRAIPVARLTERSRAEDVGDAELASSSFIAPSEKLASSFSIGAPPASGKGFAAGDAEATASRGQADNGAGRSHNANSPAGDAAQLGAARQRGSQGHRALPPSIDVVGGTGFALGLGAAAAARRPQLGTADFSPGDRPRVSPASCPPAESRVDESGAFLSTQAAGGAALADEPDISAALWVPLSFPGSCIGGDGAAGLLTGGSSPWSRRAGCPETYRLDGRLGGRANGDGPAAGKEALLRDMVELMLARLPTYDSRGLANSWHALAKLGHRPGPCELTAIQAALVAHVAGFNAQETSNVLWAFARLQIIPPPALMQALQSRFQALLPTAQPQHLATALWSLAHLHATPPPAFLRDFEAAAGRLLPCFNAQDFSTTFVALARLALADSAWPSADFVRQLAKAAAAAATGTRMGTETGSPPGASSQRSEPATAATPAPNHSSSLDVSLAQTVPLGSGALPKSGAQRVGRAESGSGGKTSLRSSNVPPTQIARRSGHANSSSSPGGGNANASPTDNNQPIPSPRGITIPSRLPPFPPQALANILWALATLRVPPPGVALQGLVAAAHCSLRGFNPQELANVAWALAAMGHRPSGGQRLALLRAVEGSVERFGPQDLGNTLWALAVLRMVPSNRLWRAIDTRLAAMAPELEPQHLSNALWACAKLGRQPEAGALTALQRRIVELEGCLGPQDVANLAWALGKLKRPQEPSRQTASLAVLERETARQLPALTPQGLANVLAGLAAAGHRPGEGFLSAAERAVELRLAECTVQGLVTLLKAFTKFRRLPPAGLLSAVALVLQSSDLHPSLHTTQQDCTTTAAGTPPPPNAASPTSSTITDAQLCSIFRSLAALHSEKLAGDPELLDTLARVVLGRVAGMGTSHRRCIRSALQVLVGDGGAEGSWQEKLAACVADDGSQQD